MATIGIVGATLEAQDGKVIVEEGQKKMIGTGSSQLTVTD